MFFCYVIFDDVSGKFYVGSTTNVERRLKIHFSSLKNNSHHNVLLQQLYNSNVVLKTIIHSYSTIEEAQAKEQFFLDTYSNSDLMLNIGASVICGDLLTRHPDRDSLLLKRINTINDNISDMSEEERKAKWGRNGKANGMYGRTHTDEVKAALSKANAGRTPPNKGMPMDKSRYDKHMAHVNERDYLGNNNPFFGRKHTEESRALMSIKLKGKPSAVKKSVCIDGVNYDTMTKAAEALQMPLPTLSYRVNSSNSKYTNWQYVN